MEKSEYHVRSVLIRLENELYPWCSELTRSVRKLYNAAMFTERQLYFGLPKPPEKRNDLENEVIDSVAAHLDQMNAPKVTKDGQPKMTKREKARRKAEEAGLKVEEKKPEPEVQFPMPTAEKPLVSAEFLMAYFKVTANPDYCSPGLGRQTAQNVVREVRQQFSNWFDALAAYRKDPSGFTGRPKIPGYLEKGGMHTAVLSNNECSLRTAEELTASNSRSSNPTHYTVARSAPAPAAKQDGKETAQEEQKPEFLSGHVYVKLPLTNLVLDAGEIDTEHLRLVEVRVVPHHGVFTVSLVLDTVMEKKTDESRRAAREERKKAKEEGVPPLPDGVPLRACSLDFGVNNLVAMTNNIGAECLLFKGGAVKSINQYYNKQTAAAASAATKGTEKLKAAPELEALTLRRDCQIRDAMHKTAKVLVEWCVSHEINTIIIGKNPLLWKQKVNMGDRNSQNFVQIPFNTLEQCIRYRAERAGIRVVEQEESYTSEASFLDNDPIPVYGEEGADKVVFSGKRAPETYHGHRKVQPLDRETGLRRTDSPGYRGLYEASDGTVINADLNGSANIGRKAFPDMFTAGIMPDFSNVRIIRFPDEEHVRENQKKQKAAFAASHRTPDGGEYFSRG